MPKPPRELMKQIETVAEVMLSLDSLINPNKIKFELYGKDFIDPLTKIRTEAFELRNNLELFKNNLEKALTEQYYTSDRFASVNRVLDSYLSNGCKKS